MTEREPSYYCLISEQSCEVTGWDVCFNSDPFEVSSQIPVTLLHVDSQWWHGSAADFEFFLVLLMSTSFELQTYSSLHRPLSLSSTVTKELVLGFMHSCGLTLVYGFLCMTKSSARAKHAGQIIGD